MPALARPTLHHAFELREYLPVKAAAPALVGEGGVGEAVAQHHLAPSQGWLNHLLEVVASRREHQEGFGQAVHRSVQRELAQLFGQGRAARFAGSCDRAASASEGVCQCLQVGGLAGAVDAFQADEKSLGHWRRW